MNCQEKNYTCTYKNQNIGNYSGLSVKHAANMAFTSISNQSKDNKQEHKFEMIEKINDSNYKIYNFVGKKIKKEKLLQSYLINFEGYSDRIISSLWINDIIEI